MDFFFFVPSQAMKNRRINRLKVEGNKRNTKETIEILWKLPKIRIHHHHIHNNMEEKKNKLI